MVDIKELAKRERIRIAQRNTERGYASKDADGNLINPRTGEEMTREEFGKYNKERRRVNTVKDAYADLKAIDPKAAKRLGWNGFQRATKGADGDKEEMLKKLQGKVSKKTFAALEMVAFTNRKEGILGWGDSS